MVLILPLWEIVLSTTALVINILQLIVLGFITSHAVFRGLFSSLYGLLYYFETPRSVSGELS